jgi:hypothetical protein
MWFSRRCRYGRRDETPTTEETMTKPTTLFTTIGIAATATALAALAGCDRPSGPPAQASIDGKAAQIERGRQLVAEGRPTRPARPPATTWGSSARR